MLDLLDQQCAALRWALCGNGHVLAWSGAIRSGKTSGAGLALLMHMERYTGQAAIVAGKTVGSVERNILPCIEQYARQLGIGYRHWRTKSYCDVGANRWYLFGAADSDSQDLVQGLTAAGLLVDEATLLAESFVQQALGRLSVPGAKAILTMNPASPRHWARTRFVDRIESGELPGMTLHSLLTDNRFITPEVQQQLADSFHGHYRRRFIDAEWASPAGLVYPDYPTAEGDAPPILTADLAIDWGTANPTAAVLLGRDRAGQWHGIREYYHDGRQHGPRSAADHAAAIVALANGYNLDRCIVDPTALSLTVELRRLGLPARKGRSDIMPGIQSVMAAFADRFLTIHPRLTPALAHELDYLAWDERAEARSRDKPHVGNDHAADAIRYWCMNRKPLRLTMQPVAKPAGL